MYRREYWTKTKHVTKGTKTPFDKLHREGGPAFIQYDNDKIIATTWYNNGKLHRTDGYANEIPSAYVYNFYYFNKKCTKQQLDLCIKNEIEDKPWTKDFELIWKLS